MDRRSVKLAPSILAADFGHLAAQIDEVAKAGAVLVMTVDPGFGGQHFLNTTLTKVMRVRQMIDAVNPACELELDGGIDPAMAPSVVAAGANVLVAGTSVFRHRQGVAAAMNKLRGFLEPAA
jgi:ribulose-phosphate 3-epimerase